MLPGAWFVLKSCLLGHLTSAFASNAILPPLRSRCLFPVSPRRSSFPRQGLRFGHILNGKDRPLRALALLGEPTRTEEHRPLTDPWEFVLNAEVIHTSLFRQDSFQQVT